MLPSARVHLCGHSAGLAALGTPVAVIFSGGVLGLLLPFCVAAVGARNSLKVSRNTTVSAFYATAIHFNNNQVVMISHQHKASVKQ